MSTYSITVRLRRVVTEEVHVSVLVTEALMKKEPEPDGTYRLEPGALFAEAVRVGEEDVGIAWRREEAPVVSVHPTQTPPPSLQEP